MPVDWSENTFVANLADDPAFSDELEEVSRELEDHPRHCVLDLSAVTFLNSSNLAQLVGLRKQLGNTGCQVVLCAVQPPLWKAFTVSGLDRLFTRAENVPLALAQLQIDAAE